jgi:gliding motility-associated-like protein
MEKENLNIEDFFRQSFNGYKIEPPENLWNELNYKLNLKQFLKADFRAFNIYYSSLIIGLITAIAFFLYNSDEKNLLSQKSLINRSNTNLMNKSIEEKNKTQEDFKKKTFPFQTEPKNQKKASIFISKQIEYHDEQEKNESLDEIKNIEPVLKTKNDTSKVLESLIPTPPKPLFAIMNKEGCVPFEVRLNNLTKNASNYYWTFGDGGKSKEKSPIHVYNYPGIYKIQLKAIGTGGTAVSILDSIIIHDKPSFKINWQNPSECYVGEKIFIPCESQNSKRFECDFGDGTIINKKMAEHAYKSVGQYSIIVKSWSENGCYDSLKVADIKVLKDENKIVFPSAFRPNPDGPSSGMYTERETNFDIFHPIVNAELADYKLVIYSRSGSILFETRDIKIGWDGYFDNRLMPEGVYPYIAKGKFENGKDFLIKGDFTILYRK